MRHHAPMSRIGRYITPVLEVDRKPFMVPREADDPIIADFRSGNLKVGIATSAWPVAYGFNHWMEGSTELQLPAPIFEWESVAAFRPGDPIVVIRLGNAAQAFMQIREGFAVPCPQGAREPLVYVSFLEVAPWNMAHAEHRQFRGLGQLMLRFASQRSAQLGFGGRIGLHATSTAEPFYQSLGLETPICPNEYNELYFELSQSQAHRLLDNQPEGGGT